MEEVIIIHEVKNAVKKIKNDKAAGCDEVVGEFIKNGGKNMITEINIGVRKRAERMEGNEWNWYIKEVGKEKKKSWKLQTYRSGSVITTLKKISG